MEDKLLASSGPPAKILSTPPLLSAMALVFPNAFDRRTISPLPFHTIAIFARFVLFSCPFPFEAFSNLCIPLGWGKALIVSDKLSLGQWMEGFKKYWEGFFSIYIYILIYHLSRKGFVVSFLF